MSKTSSLTLNRVNKLGNNQPSLLKNKLSFAIKSVLLSSSLGLATLPTTVLAESYTENMAENNAAQAAVITFNIKPATLDAVLKQFGQNAGINLSYQADAVRKVNSKGLQGRYAIAAGLQKILVGSGFKATKTSNGYSVSAANGVRIGTLATAVVQAEDLKDGSAADGYRTDEISAVGPWQGRTLQETPYSISVTPEALIQNLQATNADKIFSMNPLTQLARPTMLYGNAQVWMRGFRQGNLARNGILPQGYMDQSGLVMEEVAQVEVLTGLSGFIYGASGVGGIVNYVTKKPTDERFNAITLGNTSGSNVYLHGDFGGQFDDDGTFGYRVNLVTQDGETHINQQNIKRNSVSIALDWQITDNLIVEINGNKRDYQVLGSQPEWYMANDSVIRPDADSIDNSLLWNQPWFETSYDSEKLGASLNWQLTDDISLRAAYLDEKVLLKKMYSYGNTIQADGSIEHGIESSLQSPTVTKGSAGYIFADFDLITGSINHKITTGWQFGGSGMHLTLGSDSWSQTEYFTSSLSKPAYFPEPKWDEHGAPRVKHYIFDNQSFTLGDDIQLNQQWSALVGINYTNMTYTDPGSIIGNDYDKSLITPTISILYKPTELITTYASYIEGVEQGGTAKENYQGMGVVNANVVLEPLVSTQIELGIKANIGEMLLTAAIFNIDKALEQYQLLDNGQYKFTQDGRQIHKGLEFTATGKLTDNLTLVGGFTLLDAQIKDLTDNPEFEGNTPQTVAEKMVKFYAEYNFDSLPDLVINGGFNYNGSYWSDNNNSEKLSAYTLVNIGARYGLTLADKEVTLRLNVNNLTDERYWVNESYLGTSRTVSLSANITF
jgi:iron complex outermembrane receptor protein